VLRDTPSRGLYVRFWPPHTSERPRARGRGRLQEKLARRSRPAPAARHLRSIVDCFLLSCLITVILRV